MQLSSAKRSRDYAHDWGAPTCTRAAVKQNCRLCLASALSRPPSSLPRYSPQPPPAETLITRAGKMAFPPGCLTAAPRRRTAAGRRHALSRAPALTPSRLAAIAGTQTSALPHGVPGRAGKGVNKNSPWVWADRHEALMESGTRWGGRRRASRGLRAKQQLPAPLPAPGQAPLPPLAPSAPEARHRGRRPLVPLEGTRGSPLHRRSSLGLARLGAGSSDASLPPGPGPAPRPAALAAVRPPGREKGCGGTGTGGSGRFPPPPPRRRYWKSYFLTPGGGAGLRVAAGPPGRPAGKARSGRRG